ncbi:MAG: sigma-70 family RNA polymerase sigma factor [Betaproteobacteria bacterium]|nr:MAG: sigma-70 family RNA polymerase sigma factor [Betaproteobacteria bacterium]
MSASSPDQGDRARFEQAVLPQLDAAYNLARWLTRNGSDAEDVVQDACERALKYFRAFRGGDAKAWFLTIVRHACYDWLERNRPAEIVPGDTEAIIDGTPDPTALTPEQTAMRNASGAALAEAIAALPLGYREVLILRELEGMPYREIARVVDIPIGTVMSRLARARGLLQRSPVLHAIRERSAG